MVLLFLHIILKNGGFLVSFILKKHKKINLLVNKFIKKLKNKLKIKAKNILYDDVKVPKDLSNIISEYLY